MVDSYENASSLADKALQPDGSQTNLAGTMTYVGPSESGVRQWDNAMPLASKVLMPDGSTVTLAEALMPAIGFRVEVVSELPETGEQGVIYLVGDASPYEEYIWLTDSEAYESLGSTEVDLTGYVKSPSTATITVSSAAPVSPADGDIWIAPVS